MKNNIFNLSAILIGLSVLLVAVAFITSVFSLRVLSIIFYVLSGLTFLSFLGVCTYGFYKSKNK